MFIHSRNSMIATAVALAIVGGNAATAAEAMTPNVTEARQEAQIWTTYALSPYLRANEIAVSVRDGKATLAGKVEDGVNRDLARQIALGVDGIKEVDNQIVVQPGYVAPAKSATRDFATVIDDATITATVKSKLLWSKYTDGMSIDVDTKAGAVKLIGTAQSAAARELAGRLAMNTHGVVSVDNQLEVGSAKPDGGTAARKSASAAGADVADSWITTKVKSTFLYSSNVHSSDIAVSTSKGVVTLSGKVGSGAERALAIELAQNVRGVASVHSKGLKLL
jgi:osmotically-inducible protein OsmY